MTVTSTNWNQFDMIPGKRPVIGEYRKTIILITGSSNTGKSTLSSALQKDDLSYVSADDACICKDHSIAELHDYVQRWSEDGKTNVQQVCVLLNTSGPPCVDFIHYLLDKYIIPNKAQHILLDGYMFNLLNIKYNFLNLCKQLNYYVWEMWRIQ